MLVFLLSYSQGVTKRCRLSLLTNSALVYDPNCGGGGVAGSQPMSTAVHITWHGAQINFGDLPSYLTYAYSTGDWLIQSMRAAALVIHLMRVNSFLLQQLYPTLPCLWTVARAGERKYSFPFHWHRQNNYLSFLSFRLFLLSLSVWLRNQHT